MSVKNGRKKLPKKQLYKSPFRQFAKLVLVLPLFFFLSGYQPAFAIPPIKKSVAQAFSEQQSITATTLPESFSLPHPGYISTHFSAWHPGVDIATGLSMPVHPILKGKVIEVTYGFFGLGHLITIEHKNGYKSTYGHMGRIFVKVGDAVDKSTILGEVGLTGNTSGPHTHLEIKKNDIYIDPETLLPILPDYPKT